MAEVIDVHDLKEEDIKRVQEMVDNLRRQSSIQKSNAAACVDTEPLLTRPLGFKGKITREEIYDYL